MSLVYTPSRLRLPELEPFQLNLSADDFARRTGILRLSVVRLERGKAALPNCLSRSLIYFIDARALRF